MSFCTLSSMCGLTQFKKRTGIFFFDAPAFMALWLSDFQRLMLSKIAYLNNFFSHWYPQILQKNLPNLAKNLTFHPRFNPNDLFRHPIRHYSLDSCPASQVVPFAPMSWPPDWFIISHANISSCICSKICPFHQSFSSAEASNSSLHATRADVKISWWHLGGDQNQLSAQDISLGCQVT